MNLLRFSDTQLKLDDLLKMFSKKKDPKGKYNYC